ncbi:MAG: NapC/NirT family cytochrome c [Planctomycetota bacterium]|nr:NapC/NirT family cytochrome c [Planctomycetota bacterium]
MMDENDPVRSPPSAVDKPPTEAGESAPWNSFATGTRWKKVRWLAARGVALLGSFVLLLATLTGFAGWYTSRPQFCRSCHIMEPYYLSWKQSTHKDVSCIKCHFPPGTGEKVRGKLLGLAQLAKYVTGGSGPRPGAAEVPDASCLRSGCHETRLLSGRLQFKGIPFDHRPHLEQMRRGKTLRCTSCHSQIVQGSHMTVTTSTCFLCHFKDGHLNEGLGTCTRCHQIPEKEFDLGGGVTFSHNLAYERGVDCANCHGDLIRGKGNVPRERCKVCHNRESDLKRVDDHDFLHRMHVTDHKVDCLNCHLTIEHALDKDKLAHAASDCSACHPQHHQEQVNMLQGHGARTISPRAGGMAVMRIACPSCHSIDETSPTGTVLRKGSVNRCNECHDPAAAERLISYHTTLRASLTEIDNGVGRIRTALATAELKPDRSAAITAELENLQHDLVFLRVGNDIHNIHYASQLIHALVERITVLCRELKIEEPNVVLPEMTKGGQLLPTESESKPGETPNKPDEPAAKPDESPTMPDEPAAKTEESPAKPDEPAEKPDEPAEKMDEKPAQPDENPEMEPPAKAEESPNPEPPPKTEAAPDAEK